MKRITNNIGRWLSTLTLLVVAAVASAQNLAVAIESFEIEAGATATVPVALTAIDAQDVYGVQADITLPEGLSIESMAAAGQDFTLSFNAVQSGATRFAILSLAGATIPLGTIANITFAANDDFQGGAIAIGNIRLTVSTAGEEVTAAAVTTQVTLATPQPASYTITIADIANGTVVADKTSAQEGEVVTLTPTPAEGYELEEITVTGIDVNIAVQVTYSETTASFTMPAADVSVNATFKHIPQDDYERALEAIENGATYRIFTQQGDRKLYLNTQGYLISEAKKAATFTFTQTPLDGGFKPMGWNLGCKFTNPSLTGGSTGNVVQTGHVNVGGNDRNDWERQVFFYNGEAFAIRATNSASANWGANTYWDVIATEADLPNAGYSLQPAYVWQIEAYTDNRPEAFAKVTSWAKVLSDAYALTTDASQWTTNAQEPSEGPIANICDGNIATFFHSQWSGTGPDEDHYIEAQLPEAKQKFTILFHKRNDANRPTSINVSAGNADVVQTITEGLPAAAWFTTDVDLGAASDVVRFTVTATTSTSDNGKNNGHWFFTFGEFYVLESNQLINTAAPYLAMGAYTDLDDSDIDIINSIDEQIQAVGAQKALADDIASLNALVEKFKAQVNATDTYEGEDAKAAAQQAIRTIESTTFTSKEQVEASGAALWEAVYAFFGSIKALTPIDITDWYVVNPTPTADGNGWTVSATPTYDVVNNVAEFWSKAAATISQTIALPAGKFKLTVQAFTRTDMTGTLIAGNATANLVTVGSDVVNDRRVANTWLNGGNGINTLEFVNTSAGNVNIGITTDAATGDHWTVWRSFKLEMTEYTAEDELAGIKADLQAAAQQLQQTNAAYAAAAGEEPYQFPASDIEAIGAEAIVASAMSLVDNAAATKAEIEAMQEQVSAAAAAFGTLSLNAGTKKYVVSLAVADAQLHLSLAAEDDNAVVSAKAQGLCFVNNGAEVFLADMAAADGIVPDDAKILGVRGQWNTSNIQANAAALTFAKLPDGSYTIKTVKGYMGVDNAQDNATIFSNKAETAASKWRFAEYLEESVIEEKITIEQLNEETGDIEYVEVDPNSSISIGVNSDLKVAVDVEIADADLEEFATTTDDVRVRISGTYTITAINSGAKAALQRAPAMNTEIPFTVIGKPGEQMVNLREAVGGNFIHNSTYTFNITEVAAGVFNSSNVFTPIVEKDLTTPQMVVLTIDNATRIDAVTTAVERGNVFDLQGRKVQTMRKGHTYIIDGRKVAVR